MSLEKVSALPHGSPILEIKAVWRCDKAVKCPIVTAEDLENVFQDMSPVIEKKTKKTKPKRGARKQEPDAPAVAAPAHDDAPVDLGNVVHIANRDVNRNMDHGVIAGAPVPIHIEEPARVAEPVRGLEHYREWEVVLTETEKTESFWGFVQAIGWRNRSDGHINQATFEKNIAGTSAVQKHSFVSMWNSIYMQTEMIFNAAGVFERNKKETPGERDTIICHCIGLGRDQWNTLIGDHEILQFLIDAGECHSFTTYLPDFMHY